MIKSSFITLGFAAVGSPKKPIYACPLFHLKWVVAFFVLFSLLAGCQRTPPTVPDQQAAIPATAPVASLPAPVSVSPLSPIVTLAPYSGPNSYRGEHNFTVQYDVTKWRYANGSPFGRVLINLEIPGCFLLLQGGGNSPSTEIGAVQLAGRQWLILKPESEQVLLYRSAPFEFEIYYGTQNYTTEGEIACHRVAEGVLNRFQPSLNQPVVQSAEPVNSLTAELWPTYTSEKGGYTLRYPSGWVVTEGRKGTLILAPANSQKPDRITAEYLDFEKPEEEKLATWAEAFFALGLGPSLERTFTPVSLDVKDPDGRSQQVHLQYRSALPGEVYLITRGRLVLQILTDSAAEAIVSHLRSIANSVEFTADGPVNQEQLSSPTELPAYTTIEAWQQQMEDARLASDALRYRLQTGEVADHLLATMSERARQQYERMLVDAAEYIAAMDRQREE